MADEVLDKFTDQAIRLFEEDPDASPEQAKAARIAAEKAAEAVRVDQRSRDEELLEMLRTRIAEEGMEPRALIREVSLRASSGCDGPTCGVGCGIGCAGGCLIGGATLVGFGAAGGTTGGSGTSIALS
ncbi:MAG: hypothetical protein RIB53_05210 [Roseitalea porphyridii]|jgi:hypothetical protein|uniref:Uncharacterized protein n=1 Tax=Roseitalea porphyridii TaxID=1852022 RepID=A0A4P6V4R0_9HYPH|nr:hypothetical protein [Roseitalea porphyridii]QBK31933.1 hypothetical protein E0E05_15855 [Roseitalea porphyridii]